MGPYPFASRPLLLLLPGFFAFVAAAWGWASLGAGGGPLYLRPVRVPGGGGSDSAGLLLLGLYVPATLLLAYFLRTAWPWRHAVLAVSLAMALGLYALLCLPSLLAGSGPFGYFEETFRQLGDHLVKAAPQIGASEALIRQLRDYVAYLQLMAPVLVTSTLVGMSLLFGFFAPSSPGAFASSPTCACSASGGSATWP